MAAESNVTGLLARMHAGEAQAREQLLEVLYTELHARAKWAMQNQPANHTLQPTALVNETYMKLVGDREEPWADRRHFLAVASCAMRQILVDHARGKNRDKRAAPGAQVPLDQVVDSYEERAVDLTALDEALTRLAEFDPQMARAVEMRFFGALTLDEVAQELDIPKRTFERKWASTKAWLSSEVSPPA